MWISGVDNLYARVDSMDMKTTETQIVAVVLPVGYRTHWMIVGHFATICGKGSANAIERPGSIASCKVCNKLWR